MRKLLLLTAFVLSISIIGCGGGGSEANNVTPPEESVLGTYALRSFGVYCTEHEAVELDESSYPEFSGKMIIDYWEIEREVFIPNRPNYTPFDEYYRVQTYDEIPYQDGRVQIFIDGMFVVIHEIFSTNYDGMKYTYEYWEKVSD